jgi:hypothetical protein
MYAMICTWLSRSRDFAKTSSPSRKRLKGKVVEFVYKGVTFKVIPDKLTEYNLESYETELLAELEKEWEKDWSQL